MDKFILRLPSFLGLPVLGEMLKLTRGAAQQGNSRSSDAVWLGPAETASGIIAGYMNMKAVGRGQAHQAATLRSKPPIPVKH